jgi:drug/metabolite transporter (DMT)-like permease
MNRATVVALLALAALLEAGGDAIIRRALHTTPFLTRLLLFALGGAALLAYGCIVNSPNWTFGRLLGLYVVFFFATAQALSWLAFHQRPTPSLCLGGLLIVSGGLVIALSSR